MAYTRRVIIRLLCVPAVAVGVVACGSSSPTAPSGPTVTGVWDITLVEVALSGTLTLNETSGSVSGTLQLAGFSGSAPYNGTISADGHMSLASSDPTGRQALLDVTVDAPRRSFNGFLRNTAPGGQGESFTIRGTKR